MESAQPRLPPEDRAGPVVTPPPPAGRPASGLGAGVAVVRDWPKRTALLIGSSISPQVLDSLRTYGLTATVATLDTAEQAAAAGPFTYLIVSAESLQSDQAMLRVQSLHRFSPSARLLLEYPTGNRDPAILVRGLRAGVHDVFDPEDAMAVDEAILLGLTDAMVHRERVLAIGAHPDDVEIGCGGTILDHQLRGDRISILTLSRGAVGGDQHERLREASNTAEAVGAQLLFGDLPDTRIDDGVATIRLIEEVVRSLDPTVVYVHSKHDNHQDHRAVSTATASATRGVRRVFAYQSPSATNEFRPTQFVPIDCVLRRKVEVLLMFDSQHGRSYLEPELVVAGSRYWARHLGASARYAEPFEVIRSVGDLRQSETSPAVYGAGQAQPAVVPSVLEGSSRLSVSPHTTLKAVTT